MHVRLGRMCRTPFRKGCKTKSWHALHAQVNVQVCLNVAVIPALVTLNSATSMRWDGLVLNRARAAAVAAAAAAAAPAAADSGSLLTAP